MFVRHTENDMNVSPERDNGILEIYNTENFEKIKSIKWSHHWRFSKFNDDQILVWQTSHRNFAN